MEGRSNMNLTKKGFNNSALIFIPKSNRPKSQIRATFLGNPSTTPRAANSLHVCGHGSNIKTFVLSQTPECVQNRTDSGFLPITLIS